MDFCTLRPPNDRFLSDEIVGCVAQRRISGRYVCTDNYTAVRDNGWRQSNLSRQQPQAFEYTRARQVQSEKGKRDSPKGLPSNKSQHVHVEPEACNVTQQPETDTESLSSDKTETPTTEWSPTPKNYHHEEYRREKQVQYKKECEQMESLEKETRQLRDEITRFEHKRLAISEALPAQQNGWDVALEYFKYFQFGLQSRGRSSAIKPTNAQLELLRTAMVPDVVFNSGQGVEAMMRSWKCLSQWFQDVELELEGLDRGAAGSLVAVTRTGVTITERTLRNVFPRLCSDRRLADRLLGQRIVMRGLTRFEWDGACGRFTSVMAHSDMLTPMLRLLGSVEDVSLVFERSIISPDFQWRSSR
ncbi:hypothetical protein PF005_g25359 [Phytophthora fragariae]|uniref:BZIP domain-containing protein n=1 Tax=Phytophthora fragariae TaxID=53985 RepID=A0A6A3VXW2_9STRA|nr:hypothetical protein PF005_g25359 [Phytophthora fragariae]KAE9182565.1 hypothetical protein PF004_g24206 [Phytophthora fragariae]